MKVRISVSKAEALKAGFDRHGLVVVDVPAGALTPEQREELARWDYGAGSNEADFCLDRASHADGYPKIAEAKPEAVLVILDALIAHRKADEAEVKVRHEAAVQKWLDTPVEDWVNVDNYYGASIRGWLDGANYPQDARLAAKRQEAESLCAKLNAEQKAKKDAERLENERKAAEAKAQKEAGREALRQWALVSGSELLKARIADGFEWEGLAESEYAQNVVDQIAVGLEEAPSPDGYGDADVKGRTTPTLDEITSLRHVRQRAEAVKAPVEAQLKWLVYPVEEDEDGFPGDAEDEEALSRAELEIRVVCPNGVGRVFYFLPATSGAAKVEA